MKTHPPPPNDAQRLANLIEALASLDDDDDPDDAETRAEAEASGIDFEAWGAQIQAEVRAAARRARRRKVMTRALAAGLLAAGAAGGALVAVRRAKPNVEAPASSSLEAAVSAGTVESAEVVRASPAARGRGVGKRSGAGLAASADPRAPQK